MPDTFVVDEYIRNLDITMMNCDIVSNTNFEIEFLMAKTIVSI